MRSSFKLSLLLKIYILYCICEHAFSERVVHSIVAEVGAGNLTYYTMKQEGTVTLILHSIIGDADIYVSETNTQPDYTDYDLQSATCGQDLVTIPKEFNRPVGIGIFGHVYYPLSKYQLTVVLDYNANVSDEERLSYADYFQEGEGSNESTLWVIFLNILKIILEILA